MKWKILLKAIGSAISAVSIFVGVVLGVSLIPTHIFFEMVGSVIALLLLSLITLLFYVVFEQEDIDGN